jgi:hypothetical protein
MILGLHRSPFGEGRAWWSNPTGQKRWFEDDFEVLQRSGSHWHQTENGQKRHDL